MLCSSEANSRLNVGKLYILGRAQKGEGAHFCWPDCNRLAKATQDGAGRWNSKPFLKTSFQGPTIISLTAFKHISELKSRIYRPTAMRRGVINRDLSSATNAAVCTV